MRKNRTIILFPVRLHGIATTVRASVNRELRLIPSMDLGLYDLWIDAFMMAPALLAHIWAALYKAEKEISSSFEDQKTKTALLFDKT